MVAWRLSPVRRIGRPCERLIGQRTDRRAGVANRQRAQMMADCLLLSWSQPSA